MSQELGETFKADSRDLVSELETQLNAFGHFDDQQQRIDSLQNRIHSGRQRARVLSERVDKVRDRIEAWERADREWQERTRRRLKVVWIIISIALAVLMLFLVGGQYVPAAVDVSSVTDYATGNKPSKLMPEGAGVHASRRPASVGDHIRAVLNRSRDGITSVDDEALQALDEL